MPTARSSLVAALTFAALFTACSESGQQNSSDTPSEPRANVVIFVVDTLRADVLGPFGGDSRTSASLSRLASRGATFSDCRAPSPWTLPSLASLFTGLYPSSHGTALHGLRRHLNAHKQLAEGEESAVPSAGSDPTHLPPQLATIGKSFRAAGYNTYLRATNPYLRYGLAADFEHAKIDHADAAHVTAWTLKRLRDKQDDRPVFSVLHFIDVHTTDELDLEDMREDLEAFDGPGLERLKMEHRVWSQLDDDPRVYEQQLEPRKRMYKACVRYVDRQIGLFLEEYEKLGLGPTYFVFTSDHGEDFRDHFDLDDTSHHVDPRGDWKGAVGIGHGHNLHGSLTHVPLVITGPGIPRGRRIRQRVSLIDLYPTLCELTDVALLGNVQGRSLAPLLAGAQDLEPVAYMAESLAYGRERSAYYSVDNWVLVLPRSEAETPHLFNLAVDPQELDNRYEEEPKVAERLTRQFERFTKRLTRRRGRQAKIDAATERDLGRLGYSGDPGQRRKPAPPVSADDDQD